MALLEIQDVSSGYGEVQILWDVSLKLERGKLTALVGSNGVGKTTLLRTVMGLIKPSQGSITFDGQDVTRISPHGKASQGIVLVPEGRQLFPSMTVYENLEMGAYTKRAKSHFRENLEKVYDMLPRLKERTDQKAGTLSGGEQQMLAVVRAMMTNPKLLILDEATEGLAPLVRREIWRGLTVLKDYGQAILVIDKNLDALMQLADRHYVMEKGRVVWSGATADIVHDEALKTRYLGV